jgi:hypothetical protein
MYKYYLCSKKTSKKYQEETKWTFLYYHRFLEKSCLFPNMFFKTSIVLGNDGRRGRMDLWKV